VPSPAFTEKSRSEWFRQLTGEGIVSRRETLHPAHRSASTPLTPRPHPAKAEMSHGTARHVRVVPSVGEAGCSGDPGDLLPGREVASPAVPRTPPPRHAPTLRPAPENDAYPARHALRPSRHCGGARRRSGVARHLRNGGRLPPHDGAHLPLGARDAGRPARRHQQRQRREPHGLGLRLRPRDPRRDGLTAVRLRGLRVRVPFLLAAHARSTSLPPRAATSPSPCINRGHSFARPLLHRQLPHRHRLLVPRRRRDSSGRASSPPAPRRTAGAPGASSRTGTST